MKKFHTFEWNKRDKEHTMIILTEEDILTEIEYRDAGFEILVIPKKFEGVRNDYLDLMIHLATVRTGRVIYV